MYYSTISGKIIIVNQVYLVLMALKWYRYRSALGKKMLLPKYIAKHAPELDIIASEFVTRLAEIMKPAPEGSENGHEVENIDFEIFKWAFESVLYTIFETRFGSICDNIDPKVHDFIQSTRIFVTSIFPTAYYPIKLYQYYHTESYRRFVTSFERIHEITEELIMQKRNSDIKNQTVPSDINESSLLEYLLGIFSENDVLTCVIDLLIAGADTTSSTMLWILYELGRYPDKQAILFKEISATLPDPNTVPYKQLQNMPYLKAVVKETLRLHPVVPDLRRIVQEDINLSGYDIPSGTTVFMPNYVLSYDPDTFHNPGLFQPERFLKCKKASKSEKFASLPFGFGRRMCIGRRVAELELHTLLCRIMLKFHVECPEGEFMDSVATGSVVPEGTIKLRFIERK